LQFEVAYDLEVDETVRLYDDRLVEFRRVPVMDLHDIGGLEAIPRLALGKGAIDCGAVGCGAIDYGAGLRNGGHAG
jgi:hypothetical protein